MIVCRNLSKDYVTRSETIHALKDVAFATPNNGLFFIVGKSGSGKSTLLNIIGGLDRPDQGDVLIDGRSLSGFTNSKLDNYRNRFIGFVFQDFSLLPHLTVRDNVNLAMTLQGLPATDAEVIRVLNRVGLENVLDRKPHQLSGGQQQRVAIARALVKHPAIILADEPTGNLDGETGKQIFSLLRDIARDTLVLVVSHDESAANAYGNGIIRLRDGRVVQDTASPSIPPAIPAPTDLDWMTTPGSSIAANVVVSLGLANLRTRFYRSLLSGIVFALALFIASVALLLSRYDLASGVAASLAMGKDDYVYFYPSTYDRFEVLSKTYEDIVRADLDDATARYGSALRSLPLLTHGISSEGEEMLWLRPYGIVDSLDQLVDFGLDFYDGALPVTEDAIVVSDLLLAEMASETAYTIENDSTMSRIFYVEEGDHDAFLLPNSYDCDAIAGKMIGYFYAVGVERNYGPAFSIAAVYRTGYASYLDENLVVMSSLTDKERSTWTLLTRHVYLSYATDDYVNAHGTPPSSLGLNYGTLDVDVGTSDLDRAGYEVEIVVNGAEQIVSGNPTYHPCDALETDGALARTLDLDGVVASDRVFSSDEIVVSLGMYNKLFGTSLRVVDFFDGGIAIAVPEQVGASITLTIVDSQNRQEEIRRNYVVAGVYIPPLGEYYEGLSKDIYVPRDDFDRILNFTRRVISVVIVALADIDVEIDVLIDGMRRLGLYPFFGASDVYYAYEIGIRQIAGVASLIGTVMIVLSLVLISNVIYSSIVSSQRDIGVMKALGASSRSLYAIFLAESLFIGLSVFAAVTLLSPAFVDLTNALIAKSDAGIIRHVIYDMSIPIMCLAASILVPIAATLLPIRSIVRLAPAEAIRSAR